MGVSKETIKSMINQKTINLVKLMVQKFGGDYTTWLTLIQKSEVYASMLDKRTHMWSEGDMYLRDCLIEELRNKGVLR